MKFSCIRGKHVNQVNIRVIIGNVDNLHKRIMGARKTPTGYKSLYPGHKGLSLRSRARNIYMISSLSDGRPESVR